MIAIAANCEKESTAALLAFWAIRSSKWNSFHEKRLFIVKSLFFWLSAFCLLPFAFPLYHVGEGE